MAPGWGRHRLACAWLFAFFPITKRYGPYPPHQAARPSEYHPQDMPGEVRARDKPQRYCDEGDHEHGREDDPLPDSCPSRRTSPSGDPVRHPDAMDRIVKVEEDA